MTAPASPSRPGTLAPPSAPPTKARGPSGACRLGHFAGRLPFQTGLQTAAAGASRGADRSTRPARPASVVPWPSALLVPAVRMPAVVLTSPTFFAPASVSRPTSE